MNEPVRTARWYARASAKHELRRMCQRTSVPGVVVFDAGSLGLLVAMYDYETRDYALSWVEHKDVIQIKTVEGEA